MQLDIEQLDEDELRLLLRDRYGFEIDELKVMYKDADELRAAVRDFESVSKVEDAEEDQIGWDSKDKTVLTVEQKRMVDERKEVRRKITLAKAKLAKAKTKEEKDEIAEEIRQTGAVLTPDEVRETMKDVRKLLGNMDDDDE
jgi:hypothetical protein